MSDLSNEVRDLTTKLELHHDQNKRDSNGSSSNDESLPSTSLAYKRAQSWTTPPVQRGDAMIDPLPVSKEKEKVLSRTRPSWLPPKPRKEERKHLKEYQRMMSSFMESERRRSAEAQAKRKSKEQDETDTIKAWPDVLNNWEVKSNDPQTRDLWWKGIPTSVRSHVWGRAIGNELHLSAASYEAALARAKMAEQRMSSRPNAANVFSHSRHTSASETKADARARRSLGAINADIETGAFPSLCLFQRGQPRHQELRDILLAYAAYREDTGHVSGTASVAALLLLNQPAAPASSNPSSPVTPNDQTSHTKIQSAAAFVAFANLLNRPLNLAFCLNDAAGKDKNYRHIMRALKHKLPKLHDHFDALLSSSSTSPGAARLSINDLFAPLCQSLMTIHLSPPDAARVWDVLVFEGDGVVVRAVVGILGKLESRLYGGADEVKVALGWPKEGRERVPLDMGGDEEMSLWLRWAGREDVKAPVSA